MSSNQTTGEYWYEASAPVKVSSESGSINELISGAAGDLPFILSKKIALPLSLAK